MTATQNPHELNAPTPGFLPDDRPENAPITSLAPKWEGDPLPEEEFTDTGMGKRMACLVSDRHLRYVPEHRNSRPWIVWRGGRWRRDLEHEVYQTAHQVVAGLISEYGPTKELRAYESKGRVEAMIYNLGKYRTLPGSRLDAEPWALNVRNGTVDLRTGELRSADPFGFQTKMTNASFDPQAVRPVFDKFIREVLPDEEVRAFVQRLLGSALIGIQREHIAALFVGKGGDGKSTLLKAVDYALGDYAGPIDTRLITGISKTAVPVERRKLQGLRFVYASEIESGGKVAEQGIKALTGGDNITARNVGQDNVTFPASHTMIVQANALPAISGTDEGIWRRLTVVPFPLTLPPEEHDKELDSKLENEATGVLMWMLSGLSEYLRLDGLAKPESMRAFEQEWRSESDAVGKFVEERCRISPDLSISASGLYTRYRDWARETGEEVWTNTRFGADMIRRGYERKKTAKGRVYLGIG